MIKATQEQLVAMVRLLQPSATLAWHTKLARHQGNLSGMHSLATW